MAQRIDLCRRKNTLCIVAACGALVIGAAGCGGGAKKATPSRSSGSAHVSVSVRSTRYGAMLFDGAGRALYLFTKDRPSRSLCFGACAKAWPPFLAGANPAAAKGARSALIGLIRRSDGTSQVTYRGHPLYYYEGDRRPGQVLCQGVDQFGGIWYVIAPSGAAIRTSG